MSREPAHSTNLERYSQRLQELGLDCDVIQRHAAALKKAVVEGAKPRFKIQDTCRLDNGGVLSPDALGDDDQHGASGFIAFVPAAGAASRYSQPLFDVISALESMSAEDPDFRILERSLAALKEAGCGRWPLPAKVKGLLENPTQARTLTSAERDQLLMDLQLPKALLPCVTDGYSFLEMKSIEHAAMPGLEGQVYIAPPGFKGLFANSIHRHLVENTRGDTLPPIYFMEQGPALSTIRFNADASPYVSESGELSPVPAGHGALARLFPEAGRLFPRAHSLFIRNIDNIMGTQAEALNATQRFLAAHRTLLTAVRGIRQALARDAWTEAADIARQLLLRASIKIPPTVADFLAQRALDDTRLSLWSLQLALFHSYPDADLSDAHLRALFDRPVNTLGQVPNTGRDVGGTPCFLEASADDMPTGPSHTLPPLRKVCVEVPHVSPEDKEAFLANPAKATHFNPVFAAAEITTDPAYYSSRNQSFWLLSEKTYRGRPVIYYETVLYELIGNSTLANCVFLEVPRAVFHPHKTLQDAGGKALADWIPT